MTAIRLPALFLFALLATLPLRGQYQLLNTVTPLPTPPNDSLVECDFGSTSVAVEIPYGWKYVTTFTTAMTRIESQHYNPAILTDAHQLWQGLVPGLTAVRPGGNPNEPFGVRVRGLHTLRGGAGPLYVVDGVPEADLWSVDPADITAVTVLRDAASTAIYGGRGAQGVVLISTRPATRETGVRGWYQGQLGFSDASQRYTVLSEELYRTYGGTDLSPDATLNTDWQGAVLRQAVSQAHHLGLSGRTADDGHWSIGLHARDVGGILRNTGFEQYNARASFSQAVLDNRLRLSAGLSALSRASAYGFPEAFRYAVVYNPSAPVRSDDPEHQRTGGYFERDLFDNFNPVAMIEQNENDGRQTLTFGHLRAEADLARGLTGAVLVSRTASRLNYEEFYSKQSRFRGLFTNGLAIQENDDTRRDQLEATLQWNRAVRHHQFDLLGGYGWRRLDRAGNRVEVTDVLSNVFGSAGLGAYASIAQGNASVSSLRTEQRLVGFFGRARWSLRQTYSAEVGARRDGASNLGANGKWGLFPFASAGIDLAQLWPSRIVNLFKLRAGIGRSGSAPTDAAISRTVWAPGAVFYQNGSYQPSYQPVQNGNADLTWERHTERSAGLDFSLYGGRISGSIDGYRFRSDRLIMAATLPVPPALTGTQWQNFGELRGRGLEMGLRMELVRRRHWQWDANVVWSRSRTFFEKIRQTNDSLGYGAPGAPCGCGESYQLLYAGGEVGTFYGAVATGEIDDAGNWVLRDFNGNGFYDGSISDRRPIGQAQPRFEYGIGQRLRWRRLELSTMMRGAVGHDLAQEMRMKYERTSPFTLPTWNAPVTRYFNDRVRGNNSVSSVFVENASFLRVQYAMLRYDLPLEPRTGFRRLSLQLGGENLLTLTKYAGLDPEVRLADSGHTDNGARPSQRGYRDPLLPGIDRTDTYFPARTWWVGARAEF